ncbi:MAG: hypothetical protein HY306_10910 [Nitrosomonadales bacterium]|nr:hypothetical protein [Nitrosomonadales bacterium]
MNENLWQTDGVRLLDEAAVFDERSDSDLNGFRDEGGSDAVFGSVGFSLGIFCAACYGRRL